MSKQSNNHRITGSQDHRRRCTMIIWPCDPVILWSCDYLTVLAWKILITWRFLTIYFEIFEVFEIIINIFMSNSQIITGSQDHRIIGGGVPWLCDPVILWSCDPVIIWLFWHEKYWLHDNFLTIYFEIFEVSK